MRQDQPHPGPSSWPPALDRWLGAEEEEELPQPTAPVQPLAPGWQFAAIVLFPLSLATRLAYLLFAPGALERTAWYADSFHHWQIAFLTKEIGLFNGPRLWDLGGVEYFWGFLPPLVQATLMALFQTTSIMPYRIANIVFGSVSVALFYLLGRRYFSHGVGVAVALIMAFNPVAILTDVSGMSEPLAIMLMLFGLLYWERSPFLAGVFLALSSMTRAEYWLLAVGLIGAQAIVERSSIRFVPLVGGWLVAMAPYVMHLWSQTGNPIYPIWWNFLGNAQGEWMADIQPTPHQVFVKHISQGLFGIAVLGLIYIVLRKPKPYALFAPMLGSTLLIGYMLGFSDYILGYLDRFWVDRIMLLLYALAAFLIAIGLFVGLKRVMLWSSRLQLDKLALIGILIAMQWLWRPIDLYSAEVQGSYEYQRNLASYVAPKVGDGIVLIPGATVYLTYRLVQQGLGAKQFLSQLYHPDYRPENREEFLDWLRRYNVTVMVVGPEDSFYQNVIRNEPGVFQLDRDGPLQVYRVQAGARG